MIGWIDWYAHYYSSYCWWWCYEGKARYQYQQQIDRQAVAVWAFGFFIDGFNMEIVYSEGQGIYSCGFFPARYRE